MRVESGGIELLDTFYSLMEESWRDLGTPLYRKSYFRRVLETFPKETIIFVAYHEGSPVATGLNGGSRDTFEGMWAAGSGAHRDLQANYVLYWEMIQHACRAGYSRYHLGRSTAGSGSESFKSRWMAEPKQLYWSYHLAGAEELPNLNPENPKYDLAIRIWRRLPMAITRVVGPRIARSIP
jgi:predicted N-acyltransferase